MDFFLLEARTVCVHIRTPDAYDIYGVAGVVFVGSNPEADPLARTHSETVGVPNQG